MKLIIFSEKEPHDPDFVSQGMPWILSYLSLENMC